MGLQEELHDLAFACIVRRVHRGVDSASFGVMFISDSPSYLTHVHMPDHITERPIGSIEQMQRAAAENPAPDVG